MFVPQGARQFEIFTGKPAPEEEMFRVVLHALKQQSETAAAGDAAEPTPRPKKASDTERPQAAPAKSASAKAAKTSARSK
jgi:3-dehydroquinate dehydratase/shikimate dehydrogenase